MRRGLVKGVPDAVAEDEDLLPVRFLGAKGFAKVPEILWLQGGAEEGHN